MRCICQQNDKCNFEDGLIKSRMCDIVAIASLGGVAVGRTTYTAKQVVHIFQAPKIVMFVEMHNALEDAILGGGGALAGEGTEASHGKDGRRTLQMSSERRQQRTEQLEKVVGFVVLDSDVSYSWLD